MQPDNPFVYYVPVAPSKFVGREHLLALIFNQLRSSSRGNIALHGPLGIGKTSLLNYIADPRIADRWGLPSDRYLLCKIDCQSLGAFTPDHFWRRLLRCMSRTVDGELRESVDTLIAKDEVGFEDIQDLLDDLDWADRVLVALLDEFECVVRTETELAEQMTRHFLGMLSSLGRRAPRVFSMVIATEKPLTALDANLDLWRGSPFPTVFIHQMLPRFTLSEADELFDQALAGTTVTFSPEERRLIFDQADGNPMLLQAAGAALFDAKQRHLVGDDLHKIVERAVADSRAHGAGSSSRLQGVALDETTGIVWVNGRRVHDLTNKELMLLRLLYRNADRICSKEEIWRAVWPEYEHGMEDYPIQKLVSRLRQKIEPDPHRPQYIVTAWGQGYKFVQHHESTTSGR